MTILSIIVLVSVYVLIELGEKLDRRAREADGWI